MTDEPRDHLITIVIEARDEAVARILRAYYPDEAETNAEALDYVQNAQAMTRSLASDEDWSPADALPVHMLKAFKIAYLAA